MVCPIYFLLDHEIEHYHCHELRFAYCNICNLTFSSLKLENGLKKHVRNVANKKSGFVKLVVILFTLKMVDFAVPLVFRTLPSSINLIY